MTDSADLSKLDELRARLRPDPPVEGPGVSPCGLLIRQGPVEGPRLNRGRVHEILPDRPGHAAAIGFGTRCLAAMQMVDDRPVLWISDRHSRAEDGRLYAPGLAQAGLDPDRLILVTTRQDKQTLWVLEEALGSGALAGVAGMVRELPLTPSRRLALAAKRTGTPLFLHRPHGTTGATAAETRWQITPLPSAPDPFDPHAPGMPAWRIDLIRNRTGAPASWEVTCKGEYDDAEDALDLAARTPHRTLAARPPWGAAHRAASG